MFVMKKHLPNHPQSNMSFLYTAAGGCSDDSGGVPRGPEHAVSARHVPGEGSDGLGTIKSSTFPQHVLVWIRVMLGFPDVGYSEM